MADRAGQHADHKPPGHGVAVRVPERQQHDPQPAVTAPSEPTKGIITAVKALFLIFNPWKSAMYCTLQFMKE